MAGRLVRCSECRESYKVPARAPAVDVEDPPVTEAPETKRPHALWLFGITLAGASVLACCALLVVNGMNRQREKIHEITSRVGAANAESDRLKVREQTKRPIDWLEAGKDVAHVGDATVEVIAANKAYTMGQGLLGIAHYNERPHFHIFLRIANQSESRILDYRGFYGRHTPGLTDNFGNTYLLCNIDKDLELYASKRGETGFGSWMPYGFKIHPQKAIRDTLIFEEPIDNLESLQLKLPAEAFGSTGMVRFKIQKAMLAP
jgi:hypothetical protein